MVSVAPLGVQELRTVHDDFVQLNAAASVYFSCYDIDACAEAEDEGRVCTVEGKVAACKEDLARRGDGDGWMLRHGEIFDATAPQ